MQEVIEALETKRIVNLSGMSGIGKSSLAREASLYLQARNFSRDGVLYFGLKECPSIENFMKRWIAPLKQCSKKKNFVVPKDLHSTVELIFEEIASQDILIVLDNIDLLIDNDLLTLIKVLVDMLQISPYLKILTTCRRGLGEIGEFTSNSIIIPVLERVESLSLLQMKSPKLISETEMF